ncbi:MAG: hypothetical protein RMJ03_06975 [Nitrososphaerota archaeon]|nr:hypothetical protein [Nitrososphaerota archaeon]
MYIEGTITVGKPLLVWLKGEDVTSTIIGGTATLSINVEKGCPQYFTSALYLKNNASDSINVYYKITISTALSSSEFEKAEIHIYKNWTGSWEYVDTLELTSPSDYVEGELAQGKYLRLSIEVKAIAEVSRSFKVQVEYWT